MNLFAERLCKLITDSNSNKNRVAQATGISSGLIYAYSKGDKIPSDNIVKLAKFFNVSTDYLLGYSDSPTHTIGNVTGIGVVQDISGGTMIGNNNKERTLTVQEAEILKIFNSLDFNGQLQMLNLVVELYEKTLKKNDIPQ